MPRLSLAKLERHLYSAADRLRQEGLDAATYKDYIFGMLFLKRSSDVFDAEQEKIVARQTARGLPSEEARKKGEDVNFFKGFFVPPKARWKYLQEKLNDGSESFGGVLDKALGALSEANASLEHVLDHIQFPQDPEQPAARVRRGLQGSRAPVQPLPPAQRGFPVQ